MAPCNTTELTLDMYCCVGSIFASEILMPSTHISDVVNSTRSCFSGCSRSAHRKLLNNVMLSILRHKNISSRYKLSDCDQVEDVCTADSQPVYVLYIIFWLVVLIVAFLGNSLVILSILYIRKLRQTINSMFILSLALSDLLVSLVIVPLKMKNAYHNLNFCGTLFLCRAYITVDNVLFVASITNLLVLTVDRYLALEHTFTYLTIINRKRAKLIIYGVWCYAIMWGIPVNFSWSNGTRQPIVITDTFECVSSNKYYVTTIFCGVFYLPVVVMGYLYSRIYLVARGHVKVIAAVHRSIQSNMEALSQPPLRTRVSSGASPMPNLTEEAHPPVQAGQLATTCPLCPCETSSAPTPCSPAQNHQTQDSESISYKPYRARGISEMSTVTRLTIDENLPADSNTVYDVTGINEARILNGDNIEEEDENNAVRVQGTLAGKRNKEKPLMFQVTKTVAIVYGCFLICWLPVSILAIGLAWSQATFLTIYPWPHMLIAEILPVLNSTVNPFIYSLTNKEFRKAFSKLIRDIRDVHAAYYFKR